MSFPPLRRFLGLDETLDPRRLLGLQEGPIDLALVAAALRRQLAAVNEHPDARGSDAEEVRRRLTAAAHVLSGPVSDSPAPTRPAAATRRPAPSPPRLTAFDQQVLAVLVGSRGWNATARSKLVALSAAHGVSVQGLLTVITGLSEHAKAGGARLSVSEITAGSARLAPTGPEPVVQAATAAVVQRLGEQMDAGRPWARTRMSLFFGLITIIIGIVILNSVLPSGEPVPPVVEVPGVEPAGPTAGHGAGERAASDARSVPTATTPRSAMAQLGRMPTFRGNGLPVEAADAADECPQLAEELDWIARRLTLSTEPPLALYKRWEVAIATMSDGWLLADDSTRAAFHNGLIEVMFVAAETPDVLDRLFNSFTPPYGVVEPLDILRGTWVTGTLGRLAVDINLPPLVVEQAQQRINDVMGSGSSATGRTGAAEAWLADRVDQLVSLTEVDRRAFDLWELWIAANRQLGDSAALQRARARVIEAFLAAGTDLSHPGPSISVIGRVLFLADPTDSTIIRDRIVASIGDDRVTATDVWVLTSLLAAHKTTRSWFGDDLLIEPDAGMRMRRRTRDRIAAVWAQQSRPASALTIARGRGMTVDALMLERWQTQVDRFDHAMGVMRPLNRIVAAAHLNAAAALLGSHRVTDCGDVLDRVTDAIGAASSADASMPTAATRDPWLGRVSRLDQPGQPIGPDGQWADSYEEARRNLEERLRRLRSLRNAAGTDLGPRDAAMLVHEVYNGTAAEVRSVARAIVLEYFRTGPRIALELVDQFPMAAHNGSLADFISRLTGDMLPELRSQSWKVDARLALTRHALSTRGGGADRIKRRTRALIDAYRLQIEALVTDQGAVHRAIDAPEEAADLLLDRWRRLASTVMSTTPVPDDLAGLVRRHETRSSYAIGPTQQFVARQLAVLDLMAYVTVAEQPVLADRVRQLLHDSLDARHRADGILDQALECERLGLRLWSTRFVTPEDQP